MKKFLNVIERLLLMYDIPQTKFIFDTVSILKNNFILNRLKLYIYFAKIFHLLFLILFSYMLLCNYYSISNIQYSIYETYLGLKITIIEIVLIIWRFSYICVILHAYTRQVRFNILIS